MIYQQLHWNVFNCRGGCMDYVGISEVDLQSYLMMDSIMNLMMDSMMNFLMV